MLFLAVPLAAAASAVATFTVADTSITPLYNRKNRYSKFRDSSNQDFKFRSSLLGRMIFEPPHRVNTFFKMRLNKIPATPNALPVTINGSRKAFKETKLDVARDSAGNVLSAPSNHAHKNPGDARNAIAQHLPKLASLIGCRPYHISSDDVTANGINFVGNNENHMVRDATRGTQRDRIPFREDLPADEQPWCIVMTDVLNHLPHIDRVLELGYVTMAYVSRYPSAAGFHRVLDTEWHTQYRVGRTDLEPTLGERIKGFFTRTDPLVYTYRSVSKSIQRKTLTYVNGAGKDPFEETEWDIEGDEYTVVRADKTLVQGKIDRRRDPLNPLKTVVCYTPTLIHPPDRHTHHFIEHHHGNKGLSPVTRLNHTLLPGKSGFYTVENIPGIGRDHMIITNVTGAPAPFTVSKSLCHQTLIGLSGKTITPLSFSNLLALDARGNAVPHPARMGPANILADIANTPLGYHVLTTLVLPPKTKDGFFFMTDDYIRHYSPNGVIRPPTDSGSSSSSSGSDDDDFDRCLFEHVLDRPAADNSFVALFAEAWDQPQALPSHTPTSPSPSSSEPPIVKMRTRGTALFYKPKTASTD